MGKIEERVVRAVSQALAQIPAGGRAFLAVSGGHDSMVLLMAALQAKTEGLIPKGLELHVVHVNHGLRGTESDEDEAFVRRTAKKYMCPFHTLGLRGKRSQLECREAREAFFRELASDGADRVLTAHHLDDQAETVFLRLLRGTGLRGLAAMAPASGKKLRPLLGFTKRELGFAARSWKLRWREDSSNGSTKYERNWVRHEILPLLEKRRPGLARRLADLAADASGLAAPFVAEGFRWEGHQFFRGEELLTLSSSDLARQFGLDRRSTRALELLMRKGSGVLTAASGRFVFSSGMLLCEGPREFTAKGKFSGGNWISPLGAWKVEPSSILPQTGDSWKKRCQEAGIPVFLRGAIPYGVRNGKKRLFLLDGYEASDFGRWCFNAFGSPGDRRRGSPSRGETHPGLPKRKGQSSPRAAP